MDAAFQKLEAEKTKFLTGLEAWPGERLSFRTDAGGWSALQIVDHLVRTETAIFAEVRNGITTPHRIGIRDRLGVKFIDSVFRSDRRVKAPASVTAIIPEDSPDLARVSSRWDETRRDLFMFLKEVEPAQCAQGVFRHPVAGWMDIPAVLAFFSIHIHHHGYQLDRLQTAFDTCKRD